MTDISPLGPNWGHGPVQPRWRGWSSPERTIARYPMVPPSKYWVLVQIHHEAYVNAIRQAHTLRGCATNRPRPES